MDTLILNGVTVKNPDIYKITPNDIHSENSGRSSSGYMYLERLRRNIPTIELGWSLIFAAEAAIIFSAISPPSFDISYFDLGAMTTKTVFVGNRSYTLIRVDTDSPTKSLYSLTLNLIEM